jgi:DNA-binding transcriptional ArsR family regulator
MCAMMHMKDDSAHLGSIEDCDVPAIHPRQVMAARVRLAEGPAAADVAQLFAILGDPTRVRLLAALGSSELCVCDLAAATGINRSTVSHQLRILREHRIVRRRRAGKVIYYALDDDHVASLLAMGSEHTAEATDAVPDQARERSA